MQCPDLLDHLKVSDHAIVQYLSRTGQIDPEAIKKELVPDTVVSAAKTLGGCGKYPVAGGMVVLQQYNVVTYHK